MKLPDSGVLPPLPGTVSPPNGPPAPPPLAPGPLGVPPPTPPGAEAPSRIAPGDPDVVVVLSAVVGVTTPLPWRGAASADAPDPDVTAVGTVPMARTTRAATASAALPLSTPADAALDWTRCDKS